MTRCPEGCHVLEGEWCAECGARVASAAPAPSTERCPRCGTPRVARYCERCRHDFEKPAPARAEPAPSRAAPGTRFEAIVSRDASSGAEPLPADRTPVHALAAAELLLGRRTATPGEEPDIPLDDDPGVSRRHARLARDGDGRWTITDLGSANGTAVDGALLVAGDPSPLREGSEIRLGVHTVIRIRER